MWTTQNENEEDESEEDESTKFTFNDSQILLRNRVVPDPPPEVKFSTIRPAALAHTKWRERSESPCPPPPSRPGQEQVRKVNYSTTSSSLSKKSTSISPEPEFSSDNDSDAGPEEPGPSSVVGGAKVQKRRESAPPASNHLIFWFGLTFLILSSLHLATNGGRKNTEIFITIYSLLESGCGGLETFFGVLKLKFASLRAAAEEASRQSWQKAQDELTKLLKKLKTKFPSQTSTTWIQIYASISSTMTPKIPRSPACLVFLIPSSVPKDFGTCLAQEVGGVTQSVFENFIYGGGGGGGAGVEKNEKILKISRDHLNQFDSVDEMHEEIDNYLIHHHGRLIIVEDVQDFDREDHLFLFHAYCDNHEAPEKRATFIFTLPIPPGVSNKVALEAEGNAIALSEAILEESWTVLSSDKKPAIISRVVSSAVLLQPGDQCSVRSV